MKKVLVITLALVLALAGSAMAAVNFSGSFTTEMSQEGLKVFKNPVSFGSKGSIGVSGSNDGTDWDLVAGFSHSEESFDLGLYKLGLYDHYFDAWVFNAAYPANHPWGAPYAMPVVATEFGLVAAGGHDGHKLRVVAPIYGINVTGQFEAEENARFFVDTEVAGFDLGLGFARLNWTEEKPLHVIAGGTSTNLPAGDDVDLDLAVGAGASFAEETGFAAAASVNTTLFDEISFGAGVEFGSEHWAGDAVAADEILVYGEAGYETKNILLTADVEHAIKGETTEINVDAIYSLSSLPYIYVFHPGAYFDNDGIAVGAGATFDLKFVNAYFNVATPVIDEVAWAMANANYYANKNFDITLDAYVIVIPENEKFVVMPSVAFVHDEDAETNETTLSLDSEYKIGVGETVVEGNVFRNLTTKASGMSLGVTVRF